MSAPAWLLIVDVMVDPAVEKEWNSWYDEIHLPEITDCPGFVSGDRYVCDEGGRRRYLTVYAVDGPEALETHEFANRRGWAHFSQDVQARTGLYRHVAPSSS